MLCYKVRLIGKCMYRSLVFYMEACESGSMFENILRNDINGNKNDKS